MPTVDIANYNEPYIGKGRWALPHALLNDAVFLSFMHEEGMLLQAKMEAWPVRTDQDNPQVDWLAFKTKLRDVAPKRAKERIPKLDRRIQGLRSDLDATLNGVGTLTADLQSHAAILQDRIAKLEERRFGVHRASVQANDWLKNETISKYWTRQNAPHKKAATIPTLDNPHASHDGERYTTRSDDIADIAQCYYNGLQDDPLRDPATHDTAIETSIAALTVTLDTRRKGELAKRIAPGEVAEAIKAMALGKAAGLDGIPAEVWKQYL